MNTTAPKNRILALLGLLWVGLAACSSDADDSVYVETPMPVVGIEGTSTPTSIALQHGADGCLSELNFTLQLPEGEAALTFTHRDTFGMTLSKLVLQGKSGAMALSGGDGWLPIDALDTGVSTLGGDEVAVPKLLIWPRGKATLTAVDSGGAATVTIDLATIQFGGDGTSTLDAQATCKRCDKDDCKAPFPTWRLRDFQKDSPRFNLRYDMNAFLGQPLVTILTQGW